MKIYKNGWCVENSVESCLTDIIGLAIDYDGYRDVDNLMDLIDEMSSLAQKGLKFLHEKKLYTEIIHTDEDLEVSYD